MDFVLPSKNYSKYSLNRMTHKEFEKNETKERKRSLLHLILSYLRDCNLHESADQLATEAQLLDQYELCDNMDLDIILQDFQSYYMARFHKSPKILKKITNDCSPTNGKQTKAKKTITGLSQEAKSPKKEHPSNNHSSPKSQRADDFQIDVTCLGSKTGGRDIEHKDDDSPVTKDDDFEVSRPALCDFEGYTPEWREMAELIIREIVSKKSGLSWDDCVGVQQSVELLKEAMVYPQHYPQLFKGLLTPWKGVLLFGPPGTGKTLLAKALAAESRCTFINLTISTFVSKWRGESEKMLKVLFDVARLYSPCTIFIDELDALASKYEDNQHDASRRLKSELLVQLDGLLSGNDGIFVLATTNSPWNLCTAILRRFEKRILINVPDAEGRANLFKYYFTKHVNNNFASEDYDIMGNLSENFSGADIKTVCREVTMRLLREKLDHIKQGDNKKDYNLREPTMEDVKNALQKYHPSITMDLIGKYANWEKSYGSL